MARKNAKDMETDARLEVEKDMAELQKVLDREFVRGTAVAWADDVENWLYWIERDARAFVDVVRENARKQVARVMVRDSEQEAPKFPRRQRS